MVVYNNTDLVTTQVPLSNNGASTATNIVVDINLTGGIIYDSSTPEDGTVTEVTPTNVTWNVSSLDSGQSLELELVVEVDDSCDIPFGITWTVTADQTDPEAENNTSSYTFAGTSCCDISACTALKMYAIPADAFDDIDLPTDEEAEDWVEFNLTDEQLNQGGFFYYGGYVWVYAYEGGVGGILLIKEPAAEEGGTGGTA